jgi:predicted amidohydrolase
MAGASAAVERRKASALRSARAASADAAQILRLPALCLPLFFLEAKVSVPFVAKARMRLHRENAIAFLDPCGRGQIARSAIR